MNEKLKTIDLSLTGLLKDLSNGLTWLETQNTGYGSIQEKYKATDAQIEIMLEHPLLKNLTIFNIVDDTKKTIKPTITAAPKKTTTPEELTNSFLNL